MFSEADFSFSPFDPGKIANGENPTPSGNYNRVEGEGSIVLSVISSMIHHLMNKFILINLIFVIAERTTRGPLFKWRGGGA